MVADGANLYIAYSQAQYHFIGLSRDGGATWTQSTVDATDVVGFVEGGVADSAGNVYYAWADCQSSSCGGVPAADYRVSKTVAGTLQTTFTNVATGVQGPDCPFSSCGFSYWGPQDDIAIDAAGNLYLAWQQGQVSTTRKSPPIVNLSRSTNGGATWTFTWAAPTTRRRPAAQRRPATPSTRPSSAAPPTRSTWRGWTIARAARSTTLTAGTCGFAPPPTAVPAGMKRPSRSRRMTRARSQSHPNGFEFPYGDYMGLAMNSCGAPLITWGEGHNWVGGPSAPGHIEFRSLC